jgi:dihydroxyacetone kinase-like protein
MSALTTVDVARLFAMLATRLGAARDELCQLDGVIGDADHGIAMAQGFAAADQAIDMLAQGATLTDQFNAAAKGFLNAVGASSGPLYATAFMRAGKAAGSRTEMPLDEAPYLVVAMAEGIRLRGKAEPGEKTMVDVWAPAAAVVEAGMASRLTLPVLMARMQEAAAAGAEATKTMVATKGRASRLGERSLGHMDPGAASAAMILAVVSQDWARLGA